MVVLGSFFFHPCKSGCPISGYADGALEVHSVPLLRQPQPSTFLLTCTACTAYCRGLITDERPRTNIEGRVPCLLLYSYVVFRSEFHDKHNWRDRDKQHTPWRDRKIRQLRLANPCRRCTLILRLSDDLEFN
ncbi:hypothetical protein EVAR_9307_1 [Eumeta japonica]|uniref:Uncharacterized protein n=1 Tax=Eumeta variegata TaxID=151549 RepID=A0A4C1TLS6_EUMVA|nr:hypothetical protein EVAR_9307_1 [Eumeta japonica]